MSEIEVRGASREDYPAIAAVIERAFTHDELDLWHYIETHDPTIDPAGIRLTVLAGQVVACTVVVPRLLMTRAGWRPGAIITLVACDPDFQRRGFGGMTVRSALAYCKAQGLAVALLYGVPDYYPRFGFARVLPRLATEMPVDAARAAAARALARSSTVMAPRLAEFAPDDIPAASALYHATLANYAMAVKRFEAPWLWRYRPGGQRRIGVLRGVDGKVVAYARIEQDGRDPAAALCPEAAVARAEFSVPLFAALAEEAAQFGLERLRLVLPPDQPLIQAAVVLGAEQSYRPATSGMAAVVDWQAIMPSGFGVLPGDDPSGDTAIVLTAGGGPLLRARPELVAQLAIGYRGFGDLELLPEVEVTGAPGDLARARGAFPRLYPRWTLAPYW